MRILALPAGANSVPLNTTIQTMAIVLEVTCANTVTETTPLYHRNCLQWVPQEPKSPFCPCLQVAQCRSVWYHLALHMTPMKRVWICDPPRICWASMDELLRHVRQFFLVLRTKVHPGPVFRENSL